MAISKILHMKDTGSGFHGKHLKDSINYVMNPEKTQDGRLVGSVNCQPEQAFEQMRETKRKFNKVDKRQGYHLILSFAEDEVSPDVAFEIVGRFVKEYLEPKYEAVYVVHDNTEHVHGHIIFNSVSFLDGSKYRYEKGDWLKEIQPITNRLCKEYGLSVIDLEEESRGSKKRGSDHYKEWNEIRDGKFIWSDMIKRDVDVCVLQASDMEQFLWLLQDKGYEIKLGKHMAVKPQGMQRFRRLDTLGVDYEIESLQKRIQTEDLRTYRQNSTKEAQVVRCYVKRYRRAKMSGLQKKYYARLFRLGLIKKRAYSQAWKYKDDIKRMNQLQQEYLFLAKHEIHDAADLVATISSLTDKKKETGREKSRIYRAKARNQELFELAERMKSLQPAEQSYQAGDTFFEEEHNQWAELETDLKNRGYTLDEVEALRSHYKEETAEYARKAKAVAKELRLGEGILGELNSGESSYEFEREEELSKEKDKTKERDRKQPIR